MNGLEFASRASTPMAGSTLHRLIEKQAARTPENVAVVFNDGRLTYRELDRGAAQLAHRLAQVGAGPDTLVGLFVERSAELVIAILGILKSGAAYVPLDPGWPADRIAYLLSDTGMQILVTHSSLLDKVPNAVATTLCLDRQDWAGAVPSEPNLARCAPENLAYVIYTSGSTGRPKGVCVEHRNIVNYVLAAKERFGFEPGMAHAFVSTIAADLGNTVLFPALASGGSVHVVENERTHSGVLLSEYFKRERIDVLKIVPSHLKALLADDESAAIMPSRKLILGGEASALEWIERLRGLAPDCEIHNHYGPTEATVGMLTYRVGRALPATPSKTLPLGTPLQNTCAYILDESRSVVPAGQVGELYIGGSGVARGYLNRPNLTAERFIPDPFSSSAGARLYRTGDLARSLPDGSIEFCGRIDDQINLHGNRIEPAEIEARLRECGGVRDALVLAREGPSGVNQLVAYITPKQANQPLWHSQGLHILKDGSAVAHLSRNETDYIYDEIFVRQAYLRHGISIQDGDCVIDVGANIGLFTVFANRLARNLRTISIEPNPAAFACLKQNASAWGHDVSCLPIGISSESKSQTMTFFDGLSLLSGFYADADAERAVVRSYVRNHGGLESHGNQADLEELLDVRFRSVEVPAELRTLSSVIRSEGIDRIDLLKINVEKSEIDVLRGIDEVDWKIIRQLVIEVDELKSVEPIMCLLRDHGFEMVLEQDPMLRNTELHYVYAIRPSTRCRLIRTQEPNEHLRAVSAANEAVLTPATLRRFLKGRLPDYMVPSGFVLMDEFPLTPNGKIDRSALPAPQPEKSPPVATPAPALTDTQEALAAIWCELLDRREIGIHDDFFDQGGQSLAAMRIMSRIRETFGVDLTIRSLFENPTIAGLADVIDQLSFLRRRGETAAAPGAREEVRL
jgi:amino acid adenylation domain-containing protein/FkbM family methyltransferase